MLTKLLGFFGNVLLTFVWERFQLWWAQRQAAYYKRKAEVEKKRKESLQEGKAAEADIRRAGDTEIIQADKAKTYEDRVTELLRRAEERAKK